LHIAGGEGALAIALHWSARERWPGWVPLLAARVFALRARAQNGQDDRDGDERERMPGASALPEQQAATSSDAPGPTGPSEPSGGEDAAFDAFFVQHERALYGYLRRMLPTHDAALDVAQEAFFRAWQHFDTVRGYERPQAWLFRVATNLALDTLRRRQRSGLPQLPGDRETPTHDKTETSDGPDTLIAQMDPHDMERALAERDLMEQALSRLPERQRAALLLWAAHGLTCAEIAAALETSEVNVRQLLSRGRARFREVYEQSQS
jgi:RNA polymerase sigma-70 factor, ECF subfamily